MSKHEHEQENKRVVERWIGEVWSQARYDLIDTLLAPDYVLHYYAMERDVDLALYKQLVEIFKAAFADISMEIEGIHVDGDMVTARIVQRMTHVGEIFGIPPSGKRAEQRAIAIYRVKDGRLAEGWAAETPWPVTLAALHTT